jgi:hypothetical protein
MAFYLKKMNIFKKSKDEVESVPGSSMTIGTPTDFKRNIHVTKTENG